jgi:hypothetical protein
MFDEMPSLTDAELGLADEWFRCDAYMMTRLLGKSIIHQDYFP